MTFNLNSFGSVQFFCYNLFQIGENVNINCYYYYVFCRLSNTQECLESSLIEKENTLAKTSEKLELINSLRESLGEKEIQYKEVSDKLLQTEHTVRRTFCFACFYLLHFNIQQQLIVLFDFSSAA